MVFDLSFDGLKKLVILVSLTQARLMPLFLLLPFFNRNLVPRTVALGIAAAVGLIVVPTIPESLVVKADMQLFFLVAKEAFLGLLLGFVCAVPFWAIEAVGFFLDNQRGATMASTLNPTTGSDTSPLGIMLGMSFMVFFFSIGGMTLLLEIIYETYQIWPIDSFWPELNLKSANQILLQINRLMMIALVLASPALLLMYFIELGLGLISRFAPQLQVFFLAMPIKSAVGIFVLIVYAGALFDFGAVALRDLRNWPARLDSMLGGSATR